MIESKPLFAKEDQDMEGRDTEDRQSSKTLRQITSSSQDKNEIRSCQTCQIY